MEHQLSHAEASAFAGMMIVFMLVIGVVVHLFIGYCYKLIAEKTGKKESAWLWWIPIANILIPIRVAGKPDWWLILFLIPIVNIAISFIVWIGVAEARGKETWWGIIAAIFSIIGIPYLAFSDGGTIDEDGF